MYKHMAEAWEKREESYVKEIMRQRAKRWRRQPSIVRVGKPTRIDRARELGYKAKQGFVVVRAKVGKGGREKPRPRMGRRPKKMGIRKYTASKSSKRIAEERVIRKYPNLKAIGSYWVWDDGVHKWFEVILVDPDHPSVKSDAEVQRHLPAKP